MISINLTDIVIHENLPPRLILSYQIYRNRTYHHYTSVLQMGVRVYPQISSHYVLDITSLFQILSS